MAKNNDPWGNYEVPTTADIISYDERGDYPGKKHSAGEWLKRAATFGIYNGDDRKISKQNEVVTDANTQLKIKQAARDADTQQTVDILTRFGFDPKEAAAIAMEDALHASKNQADIADNSNRRSRAEGAKPYAETQGATDAHAALAEAEARAADRELAAETDRKRRAAGAADDIVLGEKAKNKAGVTGSVLTDQVGQSALTALAEDDKAKAATADQRYNTRLQQFKNEDLGAQLQGVGAKNALTTANATSGALAGMDPRALEKIMAGGIWKDATATLAPGGASYIPDGQPHTNPMVYSTVPTAFDPITGAVIRQQGMRGIQSTNGPQTTAEQPSAPGTPRKVGQFIPKAR